MAKLNIDKLTIEEADKLAAEVGNNVGEVCNKANAKINKILSKIGMKANIVLAFEPLAKKPAEANLNKQEA